METPPNEGAGEERAVRQRKKHQEAGLADRKIRFGQRSHLIGKDKPNGTRKRSIKINEHADVSRYEIAVFRRELSYEHPFDEQLEDTPEF